MSTDAESTGRRIGLWVWKGIMFAMSFPIMIVVVLALAAPLVLVGLFLVAASLQSPFMLRSFPSLCPAANHLPSSDRVIDCSMTENIDFTYRMSANVTREEFEDFVVSLDLGNQSRLQDATNYAFERSVSESGKISVKETYGSTIRESVVWTDGKLYYLAYSE